MIFKALSTEEIKQLISTKYLEDAKEILDDNFNENDIKAEYLTNKFISRIRLYRTGSNWLFRETETLEELALDYFNNEGNLLSVIISIGIEETESENESPITTAKPIKKTLITNSELNEIILGNLKAISTQTNWPWHNSVRLLPEISEQAVQPQYNAYNNNPFIDINFGKNSIPKLNFDINNWSHKVALQNCLLDKRLYPNESFTIGNCSFEAVITHNIESIYAIRRELSKLFENQIPNWDIILLNIAYYRNLVKVFTYHVSRITTELSSDQISINDKLAIQFNINERKLSSTNINKFIKAQKKITLEQISLANNHYAYIMDCVGDKPQQEDYASVTEVLDVDPSWHDRIPELLIYSIQQTAVKTYNDFNPQSSEQSIGTTLSLAFRYKNKLYIAWLGDSPIIKINLHNNTSEANYLYWPHRCNQRVSKTIDIMPQQEEDRITNEGGAIIIKDNCVRLNGFLMVTRGIGDRCPKTGNGISDIPSIAIVDLAEDEEFILVIGSDGLTDHLSLQQLTEILAKKPDLADFANQACSAAYNASKTSDNITAVVILKPPSGTLAYVLDGHGRNIGHLIAEHVNKYLQQTFRKLAKNPAPQPLTNVTSVVNNQHTASSNSNNSAPLCSNGFTFLNKSGNKKRILDKEKCNEDQDISENPLSMLTAASNPNTANKKRW